MKILFKINYHTNWGESLHICGSIPELGSNDAIKAVPMKLIGNDCWQIEIEPKNVKNFDYFFIVKSQEHAWRFEWGNPHKFIAGEDVDFVTIDNFWHDLPYNKPFFSSAFTEGMLRRPFKDQPLKMIPSSLNIRVEAPCVRPDEILAISGNIPALGSWNPQSALQLNDANFPLWQINLLLNDLQIPFEYKFLILKKDTKEVVAWETCSNHYFDTKQRNPKEQIVIDALRFVNHNETWKGAGTAIPVFSLRTESDFGVGDFLSINKMINWCETTGQKILQILPINDTTMTGTWVDSYPYKANSSFALHPMYLNIWEVGKLKDKKRMEYFQRLALELNSLDSIDYERVNHGKQEYLHELFSQSGEATLKTSAYKKFIELNEYWLKPYAAWCVLREMYQTPDNNLWDEYVSYNCEKIENLAVQKAKDFEYIYWLQYHLDRQLKCARDYAHSHGIVLKGDIPIGISRFSADAWVNPRLFNMSCQAGAPPDDFSILGQNWGFPTYNWEEMASDGFLWWKNRFKKMSEYFDAYRIDHILGFFRIWEIPLDAVHGLLGYFNPALPFSPEELRNCYDFYINPDVHTKPLILDWMLPDFFGEYTEEIKSTYLDKIGDDRYELKKFVNTQQKIESFFSNKEDDAKNKRISDSLLALIDDVLFIEDPYQQGHYHPRICAQFTYQYRILNDYDKWNFNKLYNDFFYHRHNEFWKWKALWKLPPLLDSTKMLTCAEDLGMIPDCVPEVMDKLEILSLEIQRMPKNPEHEFGDTWHYPYYSVCTTSTHDMSGIRAWWESDGNIRQKYYNNVLHEHGDAPFFAEPWICDKIVDLQLQSPSMLCILPLQDWLSTDAKLRRQFPNEEQINEPSNPRHYWRYRMHLSIEQLLNETSFNNALLRHIEESGR